MKEIIIKTPAPEDNADFAVVLAGISYCDKNYRLLVLNISFRGRVPFRRENTPFTPKQEIPIF